MKLAPVFSIFDSDDDHQPTRASRKVPWFRIKAKKIRPSEKPYSFLIALIIRPYLSYLFIGSRNFHPRTSLKFNPSAGKLLEGV